MTPELFAQRIERAFAAAGLDVEIIVTTNRVRMVSASRRGGRLRVRVAARLGELGDAAVAALVGWAQGRGEAARRLRRLVKALPKEAPAPGRAQVLRAAGAYHDLARLLAIEVARSPGAGPPPSITWGPRRRPRPQAGIRLGSYDPRRSLIRINRRLDDPRVPEWFVGFVVYHELLHHQLGVPAPSERRRTLHGAEFKKREAQHPRFLDAQAWEARELRRLLAG